jgi:hypothetical protein
MKKFLYKILFLNLLTISFIYAQVEENSESNIQNYTPSKLLEKGKFDIKWFNNLYTETTRASTNGDVINIPRGNYFTTSIEAFTGITESKKLNIGLIIEYKSNSFAGSESFSTLSFKNEVGKSRAGISSIAPSVKIAPLSSLPNFSIQSTFYIPLVGKETNQFGYLGNNSFIWQNRFFYDYTFESRKFQLFSELGTRLFFGEKSVDSNGNSNPDGGYANNSLELVPGAFLSYFVSNKFTVLGYAQQQVLIDLGNKFSQNYTVAGLGTKYQLNDTLNLELLYGKFVRGNDTGLGNSFNFGLRAIF